SATPFDWSSSSMQKITGPRLTATLPRSSATRGFEATISACIGKSSTTTSPDFQIRLTGRYSPDLIPASGLPFTMTEAPFAQPGIRAYNVNSFGSATFTVSFTDPSHG